VPTADSVLWAPCVVKDLKPALRNYLSYKTGKPGGFDGPGRQQRYAEENQECTQNFYAGITKTAIFNTENETGKQY
jgi:hypothetical protein